VGDGSGLSGVLFPGDPINTSQITNNGGLSVGGIVATSTVTAAVFVGDGSRLTNLPMQSILGSDTTSIEIDTTTVGTAPHIHIRVDGQEPMFVTSTGVGIGVSFPTKALQVSGEVEATQFTGDGANLTNVLHPGDAITTTQITAATLSDGTATLSGGNLIANQVHASTYTGDGSALSGIVVQGAPISTNQSITLSADGGRALVIQHSTSEATGTTKIAIRNPVGDTFGVTVDGDIGFFGHIRRLTSTLHGNQSFGHTNLGDSSVTGETGQNREYPTVGGGFDNHAVGDYSVVPGGRHMRVKGSDSFGFNGTGVSQIVAAGLTGSAVFMVNHFGIGTLNPTARLEVEGRVKATTVRSDWLISNHVIIASSSEPPLRVVTGKLPSQAALVVASSGKVGIGTTQPMAKLHVEGVIRAGAFEGDGSLLTGMPAPTTLSSDTTLIEIDTTTPGTPPHIHIQVDGQEPMFVSSIGVGIGVQFPTQALEVSGVVVASQFSGDGTSLTGVLHDGDDFSAGTFSATTIVAEAGILVKNGAGSEVVSMGQDGVVYTTAVMATGNITAMMFYGDGSNLTNIFAGSAFTNHTTSINYSGSNVGLMVSDPDERLVVGGNLRLEATTETVSLDGTVRWSGEGFEARIDGEWVEIRTEPTQADTFSTERTAPPLPVGAHFLDRGEGLPIGFSESILTKPLDASVFQFSDLPRVNRNFSNNAVLHQGKIYIIGGVTSASGVPATSDVRIFDFASGQWTQGPSLPIAIYGNSVVSHGSKIYSICGADDNDVRIDEVYVLDPQSNSWSLGVTFPVAKQHGAALSTGSKIYYFGGDKEHQAFDTTRKQIYSIDPDNDSSWFLNAAQLSYKYAQGTYVYTGGIVYFIGSEGLGPGQSMGMYDLGLRVSAALAPPPVSHSRVNVAFSFNNKIYLVGGPDAPNAMHEYDIASDTWVTLSQMTPVSVQQAGWVQDDAYGYIVGGATNPNFLIFTPPTDRPFVQLSDINAVGDDLVPLNASILTRTTSPPTGYTALNESVDIGGRITTLADFPKSFYSTANNLVYANNKVYTIFGELDSAYSDTVYAYDLSSDDWSIESTAPHTARKHNGAVSFNGSLYSFGGLLSPSDAHSNETLIYDYAQSVWNVGPTIPQALQQIEATVADNTIYLVGGHSGSSNVASFFKWDVLAAADWVALPSLNFGRTQHCATSHQGKVHVFGGLTDGNDQSISALSREVYDPQSGSWTLFNDLPEHMAAHKCLTLGGRIYLIGGNSGGGDLKRVFEFDPATETYTQLDDYIETLTFPTMATDGKLIFINTRANGNFRSLNPGGRLYVHKNTVGGQGADLSISLAVVDTTSNIIKGFDYIGDSLETTSTQDFFLHFRSDAKLLSLVGVLDDFRDQDADSGLFVSNDQNNNTVTLRSGGIERIRVDGDGSVDLKSDYVDVTGILTLGTTAETNAVDGALRFTGTDLEFRSGGQWSRLNNQQSSQLADADGNTSIKLDDPGNSDTIEFKNNGQLTMTIDYSGKVGIGTAIPVELLDVNGAIRIGDTAVPNPGTIRFNGEGFEGYNGASWVDLGAGSSAEGSSGTGDDSFIGAGMGNTASATGTSDYAAISGGHSNSVTGSSSYSFIGGGDTNEIKDGSYGYIGGGQKNRVLANWGSVGGGKLNTASGDSSYVAGGQENQATGDNAFASGTKNIAGGVGSFIAGGYNNTITGSDSAIVGGQYLTIQGNDTFGFNGTGTSQTVASGVTGSAIFMVNNFGIGTTSPDTILHVVNSDITTSTAFDSGSNTHLIVENAGHSYMGVRANNGSDSGIHFGDEDGLSARIAYLGATDSMHFSVDGLGFTDHLVIDSSGNVSIGTTGSFGKLTVDGDLISIYRNAVAGEARYHLYNGGAAAEWMFGQPSATDHGFTISKDVANTITDYFHISESSGDVGIGTTSPISKLHVAGSALFNSPGTNSQLAIDTTSTTLVSRIDMKNNGTSSYFIDSRGDADGQGTERLAIFNSTPTEVFTIYQNGNVGIGQINPSETLEVNGTAKVTTLKFSDGTTQTTAASGSSSTPSAFRVFKTSTQSIPNTTVKTITWDSADFDLGSDFELSNNRFIAPVDGVYHFDALSHWASGTGSGKLQIQLKINNGLEYDIHCPAATTVQICSVSALLKLSAGDPVTVDVHQTTGSPIDLNSAKHNTYFTGHLIKETNYNTTLE